MILTFRPIDRWDGPETRSRQSSNFKAPYSATLQLLERELGMLRAKHPVLMVDGTEDDCRLDGQLRANARLRSPRVILAFESKHGPLKYPCDRFTFWQDNLRAIALALEALRKVERYGVTTRGEQYTGWKQLPPSTIALGASTLTREEAAELLVRTAGPAWYGDDMRDAIENLLLDTETLLPLVFKYAARIAHPDQGGDEEAFKRIGQARDLLAST